MVCIRRQRLKALRAGVPPVQAYKATSKDELVELMKKVNDKPNKE